jgi:hypothetical protein
MLQFTALRLSGASELLVHQRVARAPSKYQAGQVEDKLATSLKKTLLQRMSQRLVGEGFSLNQPRGMFIRNHDDVTDMFQLVCLDGEPGGASSRTSVSA